MVALVDRGDFTAAGILVDRHEVDRWARSRESDLAPRRFYRVALVQLLDPAINRNAPLLKQYLK